MCTWLHVYVATCINVYKGTGIWREFLHASPNNPKCQGKRRITILYNNSGRWIHIPLPIPHP